MCAHWSNNNNKLIKIKRKLKKISKIKTLTLVSNHAAISSKSDSLEGCVETKNK